MWTTFAFQDAGTWGRNTETLEAANVASAILIRDLFTQTCVSKRIQKHDQNTHERHLPSTTTRVEESPSGEADLRIERETEGGVLRIISEGRDSRRRGICTEREINVERTALRVLRSEFRPTGDPREALAQTRAAHSANISQSDPQ